MRAPGRRSRDRPALSVTAAQVRAFQVRAHHLDQRAPGDALCEVAGTCGVQDSPPGAAAMALHARIEDLEPAVLEQAVATDRTLVRTWAMRGAPFVVPTADLAVFTTGVLPVGEDARTNLVQGVRQALDALPGSLDDFVSAAGDAVREVLAGERLEINELGRRVAARIAPTLPAQDRATWKSEGPYARGQPLGEGVVHFCIRILALQQVVCFGPRQGRTAPFVLVSEWLDDVPQLGGEVARRELVTRYLQAYGPSSPGGLAGWLGVTPSDAATWWDLVEDDVVPVDVEDARRWVLATDIDDLAAGRDDRIRGVRLLPPGDPLLRLADRDILVPDPQQQRALWRPLHSPGALLVDGDVVGTWRGRKKSSRLDLAVEPFHPLSSAAHQSIEAEAWTLARLRGVSGAMVNFGDAPSS